MDTTCLHDIIKFVHRVMYLEMDETEYYDDEQDDMASDEEGQPYEDNEGKSKRSYV